ncbi:hypothetical protein CONPUDRAFT_100346 [Coniophora puteana RWD-64-598 SS2]|uniref:MFS general substrate transporter n=1 Tax=Coniophora puteana (strain RWD-64-598) TaxID=741705 RepID=A0A5M3N0B9_CONPW|nr:uncharacterized protein CONPUDRAFT_100346 [Coniophora puteana RWD-64-598 SS2]EIW84355.1 hypothetical protein CONPUDRAFT_100346 [Coniophora puteana RWD-64-598 SS2]
MSNHVDRILTDPIISTENTAFSPSRSRPPVELPLTNGHSATERDPLIGQAKVKKPFYRARPLWLVPFALVSAITRGMTVASRVEVFTELSCNNLDHHYNHTVILPSLRAPKTALDASTAASPTNSSTALSHEPVTVYFDDDDDWDDPRVIPNKRCVSNPKVQAGAARLQTIITTTMGALSALTTGFWGKFGERHGRTRVLSIATLGLLLTDLTFILISTPHSPLATHSHKLLIVAPILEGALGGWSSLNGACTAYIADCTSSGSRARVFARFTGVLFTGLALGPFLGAWLIRNPLPFLQISHGGHPLESVNSVFWVAIALWFVNFLLVLFVFPESLPAAKRAAFRKGKNRATGEHTDDLAISTSTSSSSSSSLGFKHGSSPGRSLFRVVRGFLSPLAMFLPAEVPGAGVVRVKTGDTKASLRSKAEKDWSLTYLALALFLHMLASGIFQIKYLYAEHVYEWTAEQLSYYISFMGAGRAGYLLFLLPFLLATFKPIHAAIAPASSVPATTTSKAKPKPTRGQLLTEMRFDLRVVRLSLFADLASHVLVVLAPLPGDSSSSTTGADSALKWRSQMLFVAATSLASAGAGVMPAVQSLALSMLQGRAAGVAAAAAAVAKQQRGDRLGSIIGEAEAGAGAETSVAPSVASLHEDVALEPGKLFGALAVLQASGQMILGPLLFGLIYSGTVGTSPKSVFAAAGALVFLAILFIGLVSLPRAGLASSSSPSTSTTTAGTGTGKAPALKRNTAACWPVATAIGAGGQVVPVVMSANANANNAKAKRRREAEERRGRSMVRKDLRGGAAPPASTSTSTPAPGLSNVRAGPSGMRVS